MAKQMPKYTVQFVITSMSVEVTVDRIPEDRTSEDAQNDVDERATVAFNHWLNKVGETAQADPMCPECNSEVAIDSMEWELGSR